MNDTTIPNLDALHDKVTSYLDTHERILGEFRVSMDNAQNFLELAKLSADREPENTVIMLEQIKEIDLFGHLTRQYEVFREVTDMIPSGSDDPSTQLQAERFEDLDLQYEAMLADAEAKTEQLEQLLAQLQGNA